MVWGRQLAAVQAFTGTQRRGQAGDAQHEHTEHRAENDQQQGREKPDRPCHLDEYEQLQHREQQKEQQKRAHQMVPQRKNALPVHLR
jgi:hypothetical protein